MIVNMGRVHTVYMGEHDESVEYKRLSEVKSLAGDFYVCAAPVPAGILLTNVAHWRLLVDNSNEETVKKYAGGGSGNIIPPAAISDGTTATIQTY